jgi:hypothetical protein
MKKYFFMLFSIVYATALLAQSEEEKIITGSNKIDKKLTPAQVIDSLNKRFPNAKAVQYYQTSPQAVKAGWDIDEEDNLSSNTELQRYTISFKRNDFNYYALFEADGTLVMSKYEEQDTELPEAVVNAVKALASQKYKDYRLLSKAHYKQVNHNKSKDYYEIIGIHKTNPKDKKKIVLSPDGTVLKES